MCAVGCFWSQVPNGGHLLIHNSATAAEASSLNAISLLSTRSLYANCVDEERASQAPPESAFARRLLLN